MTLSRKKHIRAIAIARTVPDHLVWQKSAAVFLLAISAAIFAAKAMI
jgi:hypothetical protein